MVDFNDILERVRARGFSSEPENCKHCHDTGLVHTYKPTGEKKVYACSCELGAPNREPKFFPSDKKKERPYFLDVWGAKKPGESVRHVPDRMPYKED